MARARGNEGGGGATETKSERSVATRNGIGWNRRSMGIQATRNEWAAGGERASAERHRGRGTMEERER